MTSELLRNQSATFIKPRPELRSGYTVRVHEKIKEEGGKERIQVFEGLIISIHKGKVSTDTTFTVRRIVGGVGVERIFSLHSPLIEKIEVKKVAKVRRAKLFFLRGRRGKSARLSERFTTADEFLVETNDQENVVENDEVEEESEKTSITSDTNEEIKEENKADSSKIEDKDNQSLDNDVEESKDEKSKETAQEEEKEEKKEE